MRTGLGLGLGLGLLVSLTSLIPSVPASSLLRGYEDSVINVAVSDRLLSDCIGEAILFDSSSSEYFFAFCRKDFESSIAMPAVAMDRSMEEATDIEFRVSYEA